MAQYKVMRTSPPVAGSRCSALGLVDERNRPRYRLHSLRHFFASWGIGMGFAPKRLQTLLGHSSIQMTYDAYGHWLGSRDDDHAKFAAAEREIRAAGGAT